MKDESYARMSALNVLAAPAVAVDGKVVLSGPVPSADEVRTLQRAV